MAMKESGIEWVGLIPDTWSVIPNKYVMHKEKNLCEKWSGEDVMSLTMNGVIVRDLQNPTGKMPATFDGYQYIEDGDLLMCLFDIDVTPRCVGRVTHNGVTSPAYSNFKVHDNASRDYFYYYYLMVDNTKELLHLAKNLRHSFTEEQLGQLKVPMPLLSEQQAIADYLDETCSKIDEIIAEAKASIDEYKELKQSVIFEAVTKGLDKNVEMKEIDGWIRWLPKGWNFRKINGLFNVIGSGTTPKSSIEEYYQGTINWLQSGDINGTVVKNTKKHISDEIVENTSALVVYDAPFIAIAMYGASIGNISIVDINACTNQACCVLSQPTKYIDMVYSFWCIMSAKEELLLSSRGGGQPNISQNIIKQLRIPLPPLMEQRKIADYLNDKTKEIDSLIAEKECLINDLEAYKKSLIYEVVTGKRRVV